MWDLYFGFPLLSMSLYLVDGSRNLYILPIHRRITTADRVKCFPIGKLTQNPTVHSFSSQSCGPNSMFNKRLIEIFRWMSSITSGYYQPKWKRFHESYKTHVVLYTTVLVSEARCSHLLLHTGISTIFYIRKRPEKAVSEIMKYQHVEIQNLEVQNAHWSPIRKTTIPRPSF